MKPPSDELLASTARENDLQLLALEPKSNFVFLLNEMNFRMTGLTATSFLPAVLAVADCFLGPSQFDFVTETD